MTDQRGLIITTSDFTKDARKEALAEGKTPISLVGGNKLMELLVQNDIGVSKKALEYLVSEPSQFEELGGGTERTPEGKLLGIWLAQRYLRKMLRGF